MKIYIASDFNLIPKIEGVAKTLEEAGHTILVKWWSRKDLKTKFAVLEPDDFYAEFETANAYERDFNGVKESDVLLFVADETPRFYGGANVELGIALGDNKRCIVLGRLKNSAMYWPVYRAKDINEVLELLTDLERWGLVLKAEESKDE